MTHVKKNNLQLPPKFIVEFRRVNKLEIKSNFNERFFYDTLTALMQHWSK